MSEESSFELTKKFFKTKPACSEALMELASGVELEVELEDRVPCALYYDKEVQFEKRAAKNPDITFVVNLEAVRRLMNHPGDNLADLGIEITREVFQGNIKIRVHSGILSILSNGYISIIKKAGPDFMGFLAKQGFGKIDKILTVIKSMRS